MASFFTRVGEGIRDGAQDLALGVTGEQTGEVTELDWKLHGLEHGLTFEKHETLGARLGVLTLDNERDTPVEDYGAAIVAAVAAESEAAAAGGAKVGDVLVKVNGAPCDGFDAALEALKEPSRPLTLTLRRRVPRDGAAHSVLGAVNWRLEEEMSKAAVVLATLIANSRAGVGLAPRPEWLKDAAGFAVLRVTKVGLWFSARFGTGLVVSRLDDGSWSAPSALGTVGGSFGVQAGASVGDFVFVLRTKVAVAGFCTGGAAGGQIQYGAQAGASAGTLGLSREATHVVEGDGWQSEVLAYAMQRGLYAGVSVEGSVLLERASVNARFYGDPKVTASSLLCGEVARPTTSGAAALYATLAEVDALEPLPDPAAPEDGAVPAEETPQPPPMAV